MSDGLYEHFLRVLHLGEHGVFRRGTHMCERDIGLELGEETRECFVAYIHPTLQSFTKAFTLHHQRHHTIPNTHLHSLSTHPSSHINTRPQFQ
jgi:hypothetical protein